MPINKPIINNIPQSINTSPVIHNASFSLLPINNQSRPLKQPLSNLNINQLVPEEPKPYTQDDSNFLASLISQSAAMLGAGIRGGNLSDVAQNFQEMRDRRERQKEQEDLAKKYTDPNSEESKKRRLVYKSALGIDIPENYSYTDLNDPIVLQSIRDKSAQARIASIPKQRGVSETVKPKEEPKSEKKLLDEYSKHAEALQSSIDTIEAVNRLSRTRIGRYTPDFSTSTQAESGTMDRAAAGLIKVLAGPGTVSDSDAARLGGLVPNSNMNKDLAAETTKRQTLEGTQKALAGLRIDRDLGRINETDFKKIINQYNKYLKNPKLELNKEINQDGEIVDIANDIDFSNLK